MQDLKINLWKIQIFSIYIVYPLFYAQIMEEKNVKENHFDFDVNFYAISAGG